MKKTITLLLILLAGTIAQAETITNTGKVYYDVALLTSRCDAASITFTHKAGIAKLDFMELSAPNQKRFGFDPVRYQAFKDEEAKLHPQPSSPLAVSEPATSPAAMSQPETPMLAPSKDFKPIVRVVVITNAPPRLTPFGASPVTTLQPDNDKMNDARSKIMRKAMGINSGGK
jgi:hypothetical protein